MLARRRRRSPCTRVKVFLRWGPTASSGTGDWRPGARSGKRRVSAGPAQDDRAHCRPRRTTESSYRVTISRSCSRKPSAMPAERLRASSIPGGDRLLAEVAAGHHQRTARPPRAGGGAAACTASITPIASRPGATDGASAASPRRKAERSAAPATRSSASSGPDTPSCARLGEGTHHHRERLRLAMLALRAAVAPPTSLVASTAR